METKTEYTARPACPVCGQYLDLLPALPRGRRRQYCSNHCRQIAYRRRLAWKRKKALATSAAERRWLDALSQVDVDQVLHAHQEARK